MRSRRDFLRSLSIGAAATGAALRLPLESVSAASTVPPVRPKQADAPIRLDNNENAYGPSPSVAKAIRAAIGKVNRYPIAKYDGVVERIASVHQVKAEQVLIGCGSTEILRAAACAFVGNGRQLIQPVPTFGAIEEYAKSVGSEIIGVRLTSKFAHDLDGMLARVGPSTGLIYICNPNNPTGSLTPRRDLETFIGKLPAGVRVLIDEAYHEYALPSAMYSSFIERPLADDRVIVTRTFSKVYGLAGLRLGYAVAHPQAVEKMRPFLTQDGLNAIAAEVAGVALEDNLGLRDAVTRNRNDRQEFFNDAGGRMLKPIDSQANFVMMDVQHPAVEVIEHFRKHNILIGRHFPPLDNFVRISLGTPEEMIAFWQAWDLLPWAKMFMHH